MGREKKNVGEGERGTRGDGEAGGGERGTRRGRRGGMQKKGDEGPCEGARERMKGRWVEVQDWKGCEASWVQAKTEYCFCVLRKIDIGCTCQLLLPGVGPLEGGQGRVHRVQTVTQLGQELVTPPISPQVGV